MTLAPSIYSTLANKDMPGRPAFPFVTTTYEFLDGNYLILDAPRGARVGVVQYGLGLGAEPARRSQAQRELTKPSRWAEESSGDIRFLMTLDRVNVDKQGRFDVHLAVIKAASRAKLMRVADEVSRQAETILASMRTPETAGVPSFNVLAPHEFALHQRLPGLQTSIHTSRLVRRQEPIALSVIGGRPGSAASSSAAVAAAIRRVGVTALNFDVPTASRVVIRIYDRTGALVRRLLDEELGSGAYAYAWDGMSDDGRRMPPGVYYAVMEAGEFSGKSKLILVR